MRSSADVFRNGTQLRKQVRLVTRNTFCAASESFIFTAKQQSKWQSQSVYKSDEKKQNCLFHLFSHFGHAAHECGNYEICISCLNRFHESNDWKWIESMSRKVKKIMKLNFKTKKRYWRQTARNSIWFLIVQTQKNEYKFVGSGCSSWYLNLITSGIVIIAMVGREKYMYCEINDETYI